MALKTKFKFDTTELNAMMTTIKTLLEMIQSEDFIKRSIKVETVETNPTGNHGGRRTGAGRKPKNDGGNDDQ